ncbi:MAG: acetylxylan esterase [Planctomycetes bacterium]|nr:acetylxylan esterase [Planctomycetota bacterium]
MRGSRTTFLAITTALSSATAQQQPTTTCAPDPFVCLDGTRVTTAAQWRDRRRPELLELFRRQMYGRAPGAAEVTIEDRSRGEALDGAAVRKQWRVRYAEDPQATIDVLAYLPADRDGPVPVFVALNFDGNQTVHADPAIRITTSWVRNSDRYDIRDHRANEATRGVKARRWPIADILARGYGLVTAYYGDLDPDFDDGFANGAHGVLDAKRDGPRPPDAWGAIGAWAWGLSRIADSLGQDPDIDVERIAVLGHSRLGKTALWAGAQDERFALVISNDSGCGGAAYSRRRHGETVAAITKNFPHWFCRAFRTYADHEDQLPFDQHLLLALCAPRPVYVASAEQDQWADPEGEFLSAVGADPVYRLLCDDGLPAKEMPALDESLQGRIGYHIRSGKHDLLAADWRHYLDFADRHLR